MGASFLRFLPILAVCLYACGMGLFFAQSAARYPNASGVIPAALAFGAVAFLGIAVMFVMGHYERRLRDLDQRLRESDRGADGRK